MGCGRLWRNRQPGLVNALSAFTGSTVLFVLHFFLFLYTLLFFLKDEPQLLATLLEYVPLATADKQRIVARFRSVARATLKGAVVIGCIQGVQRGLAF